MVDAAFIRSAADAAPPFRPTRPTNDISPAKGARFQLLSLEALEKLPRPEWLLEGMIPESTTTTIYGPPRNLKSFVALAWSLSIAYGLPWAGRPVKQGAVIYLAAEGAAGMKKRVKAWRKAAGMEEESAPFALLPTAVNMVKPEEGEVEALIAAIQDYGRQCRAPVKLLVIDTLARCFAGGDEDRAGEMGAFVRSVDHIREQTGAAILIVHHSGKDKERGPRGSSSLFGAMDAAFECDRDPAGSLVTVRTTKQKDAEEAAPLVLKTAAVEWHEDGEPEGSIILEPTDEVAAKKRGRAPVPPSAQVAMTILVDTITRSGGNPPHGTDAHIPRNVRVVSVAAWREAHYSRTVGEDGKQDTKRKAFTRAVDALQRAGLVGIWTDYAWLIKPPTN